MPVFTIEIDTDAKTCKKMVNGVEMDFDSMEVYQYTYIDRCDGKEERIYNYGVRVGIERGEESISHNFRWEERQGGAVSELQTEQSSMTKSEASEKIEEKKKYYLFDEYKKDK